MFLCENYQTENRLSYIDETGRLADILHGPESKQRLLAMFNYRGYFDESGIHADAKIVVVAGYVARAFDWRQLERKWRKALKGVEYYHTTDIEADPPRGIYWGWSRKKADTLTDKVVRIVEKFRGQPIGIHVRADVWKKAIDFLLQRLPPNQPFGVPYQILAKECMEVALEWLPSDLAAEETLALVFENNEFGPATLQGFNDLKSVHPLRHRFGAIAFEGKAFPGLQAADLFAWHYRRAKEVQLAFRQQPAHRAMRKVINKKQKPILRYIDDEYLNKLVARAFDQILLAESFAAMLRGLFRERA